MQTVGPVLSGQVRCGVPACPNGQHELYFPVGIADLLARL